MIFVGYCFTKEPIEDLVKRGFQIVPGSKDEYSHDFNLYLPDGHCIRITEILSEESFLTAHKIKNFDPYVLQDGVSSRPQSNLNTVSGFAVQLGQDSVDHQELKLYWQIRKRFKLWALHLYCENINKFIEVAKPDHVYDWQQKSAALIHLGPNCFDLLVTQK